MGGFKINKANINMILKLTRDMTLRISWADGSSSWFLSWEGQSPEMAELGEERANMRSQACPTAPRMPWLQVPTFLPPHSPQKLELEHCGPYPTLGSITLAVAMRQWPFLPTFPKYPGNPTFLLMQICDGDAQSWCSD